MNGETLVKQEQFHNCNAYTNLYTTGVGGSVIIKELVSYGTPVARVAWFSDCSEQTVYIELGPHARCSGTTTRQVARFLREIAPVEGGALADSFYKKNGHGYHSAGFYTFSTPSGGVVTQSLSEVYKCCKRSDCWFNQRYIPWKSYYNAVGFKVEGMHK